MQHRQFQLGRCASSVAGGAAFSRALYHSSSFFYCYCVPIAISVIASVSSFTIVIASTDEVPIGVGVVISTPLLLLLLLFGSFRAAAVPARLVCLFASAGGTHARATGAARGLEETCAFLRGLPPGSTGAAVQGHHSKHGRVQGVLLARRRRCRAPALHPRPRRRVGGVDLPPPSRHYSDSHR